MDAGTDLERLMEERWPTGRDAVNAIQLLALRQSKTACVTSRGGKFRKLQCSSASSGCTWCVHLNRSFKGGPGDWHVTRADLDHINCLGRAKPTRKQLAAHHVVRSALASNPSLPARALVTQLRHQEGMSASQNTMYRAKEIVTSEMFSEDPTTIARLPSFLAELKRLNPGVYTAFECYKTGHFRRAIVVLNAQWFLQCQGVFGVDAAHMKHRRYNGVKLILVGRDGNFANQIAAVALAPVEDFDNYAWFFGCVLSQGFPLKTCPTFSDRNVGLVSAAASLGVFNMYCIRHIIGNMRADKSVRLSVSQEKFVWAANAATTEDLFVTTLKNLESVNSKAAAYLRAIPAAKWTLYPHFTTCPLYGWRTTNFVESEQAKSLKLKPRLMLPFEFFKSYATILMGDLYTRSQQAQLWVKAGRTVTPRAETKFQSQLKEAEEYTAVGSDDHVAYVSRVTQPLKQRRVDTTLMTCSCETWLQLKIPCRHLIAALNSRKKLPEISALTGHCYQVATYLTTVGSMEIPEDHSLVTDPTVLPAKFIRQAGRPKKRRIGSRGEGGDRVRRAYKCGKCGSKDGHNRATCRLSEG